MTTDVPLPLQLRAEHMRDARLFADRRDLIEALPRPLPRIAEVGVALGDFSEFLIRALRPTEFIAIDTFVIHQMEELWGKPTFDIFGGLSHEDYYRRRLQTQSGCNVVVQRGSSFDMLARHDDESFDMIYIDADHTYPAVKRDAEVAIRKIKSSGVLIFNDYIQYDPIEKHPYGVVPVVNELVVEHGFKIIGFALQRLMFCDIAIQR